jgi:type VI secretion system protein ImpB
MSDSSQHRVGGVRPPRVQITYDVEDGGQATSRELPMVAGVISDLSGDADDPRAYEQREFVEVEQGGVNRLMKQIGPKLEFAVPDEISGEEGADIPVSLDFNSIDDFSPVGVAVQIPQTAKLLEVRRQLADLYGKVEANDKLDGILGDVLADADKREALREQLDGIDKSETTEDS